MAKTSFLSNRTALIGAVAFVTFGGAALTAAAQTASGAWLVDAARNNDTAVAGLFIERGADVDQVRQGDGTALIVAAGEGDLAMARLLIANGASVNRSADGDGNPLIAASAHGRLEMADYLIAQGADVNAVVADDETALINAAREGHLDMVQHLVAAGADVNLEVPVTLRSGATEIRSPLSQARRNRHAAVSAFLVARGARS